VNRNLSIALTGSLCGHQKYHSQIGVCVLHGRRKLAQWRRGLRDQIGARWESLLLTMYAMAPRRAWNASIESEKSRPANWREDPYQGRDRPRRVAVNKICIWPPSRRCS